MKRLNQILPVILAVALQIMPLLRNFFVSPAAGNTIAFILRWGIGSAATVGVYDACSGATGYNLTSTNHIYGTNGNYMSNSITLVLKNGTAATNDYIIISTTSGALVAGPLYNGQTATNGCLPPGLIFKCSMPKSSTTIGGFLYGTPSNAVTALTSNITITVWDVANGSGANPTNLPITILPAASGTIPNITNQPVSLTNNVGSNPIFSVTAGGTGPLSYQWFFNTNSALLNQTNTSLTVTNVQLTNAGNYRVIVTNSSGSVTSSFASLTVWQPPVITNQPMSATNIVGNNTSFSVVAGGFPAVGYQWYFNTNTPLANATNAALPLNNLQLSNAGSYSVVISNSAGSVTSSFASLTVWQPPVITNQPASATNTVGNNTSFNVVAGGYPAVGYQWYFNTNTPLLNATNATLALNNLQLTNAGYYSCTISSVAGSVTSTNASLTVWQPPVITNQPLNQTAVAGGTATFSVVGGGLPVPGYQWFFNGSTPLAGATTSSLILTNLRSAQVGSYSVVLSSAAGSLTSSIVSLTVTNPLPPVVVAAPVSIGGAVQINFASVPGLTNVILTNGYLSGGVWGVYSNIPPSPNSTPITIADLPKDGSRFYRLMVQP